MARKTREDPFGAFNFRVQINPSPEDDNKDPLPEISGGFSDVSGLAAEMEVHDYREGGRNDFVHKCWGPTKFSSNLILKRGVFNIQLLRWFQQVTDKDKKVVRATVTVDMLNTKGNKVMSWDFAEAYPVKWSGPNLQAASNAVALETLELAHHGMTGKQ